jgi:hypothetical protein
MNPLALLDAGAEPDLSAVAVVTADSVNPEADDDGVRAAVSVGAAVRDGDAVSEAVAVAREEGLRRVDKDA